MSHSLKGSGRVCVSVRTSEIANCYVLIAIVIIWTLVSAFIYLHL